MAYYGEKTSEKGEYRQTGQHTFKSRVQGKGRAHYKDAQGAYYTWFPEQTAPAPAPPPSEPKPEPKDDLVIKQRDIKHSPEIQEAKERVNNYQQDSSFKQTYLSGDNFDAQKNFTQAESLDLNKYY